MRNIRGGLGTGEGDRGSVDDELWFEEEAAWRSLGVSGAIEEQTDGGAAHAFAVLADGGERGFEPFTFVEAAKADEGDVARDDDAGAAEDEAGPDGEEVAHGEDGSAGRRAGAGGEEFGAWGGEFPRAVDDPMEGWAGFDFFERVVVTAEAGLADSGVIAEGDTGDAAVAEAGEVVDGNERAMIVIRADEVGIEAWEGGVDADERDAAAAEAQEDVAALAAVGDREHDDAIDAVLAEEGDAAGLFVFFIVGLAEEDVVAGVVGGGFDAMDDVWEIGVGEIGDEDTDHAGAPALEGAGSVMGVVVKFFCGAEDAGAGGGVVAGVFAGKDIGDGAGGEAGGGGDIAERDGHERVAKRELWIVSRIRIVTNSITGLWEKVKGGGDMGGIGRMGHITGRERRREGK